MTKEFDKVWWPEMLWRLRDKGVKSDFYRVVKDYFRGRWIELREGTLKVGKRVNNLVHRGQG